MITITKTFLPKIEEFQSILARAWQSKWVTNRGELVLELEQRIKDYLSVSNIIATTNGTIPLQIAIKLFANQGEVITTPFSYVASTSSIVWEGATPVFVDIDPEYLTIDETKIEAAITNKTTAILATHVFGNPCNVEVIESIAKRHNLKVIYDAAHCFGVLYKNKSVFNYGDISTCSFHATKLFHTAEGGAMFCNDTDIYHKLFYSHNFGHNGALSFHGLGINGKMSELQAAMGLAVLPHVPLILKERKKVVDIYLSKLDSDKLQFLKIRENTNWNYAYFPIIFESEGVLLQVEKALNSNNIIPRRYFYPSLNNLTYVDNVRMSVSDSISKRILCLPLYLGLKVSELNKLCLIINENISQP